MAVYSNILGYNQYLKYLQKLDSIDKRNVYYWDYQHNCDQFRSAEIFFEGKQDHICIFDHGKEPIFDQYFYGGYRHIAGFKKIPDYVNVWCSSYGESIPDNFWFMPFWLQYINGQQDLRKTYITKERREIKMHCWMRRPHIHRLHLADALYETGNLQKMEVVFPHALQEENDEKPRSHLKNHLKYFEQSKEFLLNDPIGCGKYENPAARPAYDERDQRYMELVCETRAYFDKPQTFYSEKTFRIFRAGQLAIFWATPNHVKFLKDMGFKLFEKYVNHEYDNIEDNETRLKVLMYEITRLNNLSDDEWHQMWIDTHQDRIFNQTHLLNILPNQESFYEYAKNQNKETNRR